MHTIDILNINVNIQAVWMYNLLAWLLSAFVNTLVSTNRCLKETFGSANNFALPLEAVV